MLPREGRQTAHFGLRIKAVLVVIEGGAHGNGRGIRACHFGSGFGQSRALYGTGQGLRVNDGITGGHQAGTGTQAGTGGVVRLAPRQCPRHAQRR